jgi:hypothetical protein
LQLAFFNPEILEGVGAGNNDRTVIHRTKGALESVHDLFLTFSNLLGNALDSNVYLAVDLELVPIPQNNKPIWRSSQRHNQLTFIFWRETGT